MHTGRTVLEAKRLGVYTCTPETHLEAAASQMLAEDISSLVVTDAEGYLCGILTRMDILRAYLRIGEGWARAPVGDVMSREVVTVRLDTALHEAVQTLMAHHIHRVVAVQEEGGRLRPLAVLSDGDLVYHLAKGF